MAADNINLRLLSTGYLQFYSATLPKATSALPVVAGTWFCIQYRHHFISGLTGYTYWLNGNQIDTIGTTTQTASTLDIGWINAPGTAATNLWLDDISLNAYWAPSPYENTLPRMDGRNVILPISRLVSNDGWTSCKNTTTEADLVAAVNTYPPAGHSDVTNHSTSHQMRNILAGNVTPRLATFECESLGRAGIAGNVYLEPGAATYSAFGNTAARTRIAQGFYLNGTLELPRLWLRKVGTPSDTITLSLLADSSGSPSATVLHSTTYSGAALSTSVAAIDFTDLPNAPLTPKTKYWLELKRSGANDASNYYEVETCASGLYYDGGEALYNASWGAPTVTTAWHLRLYSTEGASMITSITVVPLHAEGVGTGSKTGQAGLSAPTSVTVDTFTYGADAGAAGTFPATWYWIAQGGSFQHLSNIPLSNAAIAVRPWVSKTDSGTRAALVCGLLTLCEWQSVEGEWLQFTKIVGGATWYGKHTARITSVIRDDDSELVVDAGDWIMLPSLPSEDTAYPAATVSVTDATLRTDYTLVGPAG